MEALESLLAAAAGSWSGSSTLKLGPDLADTSDSEASFTSMLGGWFARLDYSWSFEGKPQEGSLLVGHEPKSGSVSMHWIDRFHMSRKVLALAGTMEADGRFSALGSYPAPEGPDWGWRIDLSLSGDRLRMVMYNIEPGAEPELAVEAEYRKA
jgi:hypothetical protein